MPVRTTVDKLAEVARAIDRLSELRTMVGIPSETTHRQQDLTQTEQPTNAELGYLHEFGAPEAHIPPRPFLYPTVREQRDEITKRLRILGNFALSGRPDKIQQGLEALGLFMQNKVRMKIRTGPFVPLAESTLEARRARGITRTKPLIDTGQLLSSVTYVVRRQRDGHDVAVGQPGPLPAPPTPRTP